MFGQLSLIIIMIKNGAAVLGPTVGKLPAIIGRVNLPPKDPQEILIGDVGGIVNHLHRLTMPGFPS